MRAARPAGRGARQAASAPRSADETTDRPADLVARHFRAAGAEPPVGRRPHLRHDLVGWVYVAFVVDVFSRLVVGWQARASMRTDLALDALEMALWAGAATART